MKLQNIIRKRLFFIVAFTIPLLSFSQAVGIFCDSNVPQIKFAANDIKNALQSKGYTVEVLSLSTLSSSKAENKIVIALASDAAAIRVFANKGGAVLPVLGEQAYALRTTTTPQNTFWALGGDVNGAMYGGLQLAENIRNYGFDEIYNSQESPYILNRGIKANLPLDARSPTYYGSGYNDLKSTFNGTAARLAIPNVWDINYWKEWFDEMARSRFNVLTIWNCHPFPALGLDMPESFTDVQGFNGFSKKMSKEEKVVYWKEVMAYGKGRGFKIYFVTWNIYTYGAIGSFTNKPTDQKTADYTRKAVRVLLETYPDLDGIGVSAGENMAKDKTSIDERIQWLAETYGNGIADFAKTHPERKINFLHRWLDADVNSVVSKFAAMLAFPNVNLDMTFKYSAAHLYATPDPAWINLKDGIDAVADLGSTNKKTWLELRNDDFYYLSWGDPQFVRASIAGFPDANKYIAGFMYGGDGWTNTRDFTSKNSVFKGMLEIKRDWLSYRLWGRLSYNPQTPDKVFVNEMSNRYPKVNVQTLFDAWTAASRGVPLAAELVMGARTGSNYGEGYFWWDWQWWPEMCQSSSGLVNISTFQKANPAEGSTMCGIKNTANNSCLGNNRTSLFIADTIELAAKSALQKISNLDAQNYADLELYKKNISAQSYLSLYYAEKIRGATYQLANNTADARAAMGKAYCYWISYTNIMNELHSGANMMRTNSIDNWSVYNESVLKEYIDLGGVETPSCETTNNK